MNIQKAYKPKYQPFNRGGYIKHKRIYKTVDSIDIQVEVTPVPVAELAHAPAGEPSAVIRERVVAARAIQTERYKDYKGIHCNAQMTRSLIEQYARPGAAGAAVLEKAMKRLDLSARAYDRILKVARTIADLEGCENVEERHIKEAVGYRSLDRGNWGE